MWCGGSFPVMWQNTIPTMTRLISNVIETRTRLFDSFVNSNGSVQVCVPRAHTSVFHHTAVRVSSGCFWTGRTLVGFDPRGINRLRDDDIWSEDCISVQDLQRIITNIRGLRRARSRCAVRALESQIWTGFSAAELCHQTLSATSFRYCKYFFTDFGSFIYNGEIIASLDLYWWDVPWC